jgi:hypothetical protein
VVALRSSKAEEQVPCRGNSDELLLEVRSPGEVRMHIYSNNKTDDLDCLNSLWGEAKAEFIAKRSKRAKK